ncbi:MAG: hypothetical protein GY795_42015 [Desulfobacterales bacterium]|nr:hypothetical protein [Desulfobacterales bacterium]
MDKRVKYSGGSSAYIEFDVSPSAEGYGLLMQSVKAGKYIGKRVRLSAYAKGENVEKWAALWLYIYDSRNRLLTHGYENIPTGASDWKKCSVVLDIPEKSEKITFGSWPDYFFCYCSINYCLQMEKSRRIFHDTLHNTRIGGKYCEIFPCFFCRAVSGQWQNLITL